MCRATSQPPDWEKERNEIAWGSAEIAIKDTDADVLVIFDCCAAGAFNGAQVRNPSSFEFLAACTKHQRTPKPGPTSFTSALMWALRELRKSKSFNSLQLSEKILEYNGLDKKKSRPILLRPEGRMDSLVWIAPLNLTENGSDALVKSEERDPESEFVDLRLFFYRKLEPKDAENLAKQLSHLVNNKSKNFGAKQISVIQKTSLPAQVILRFQSLHDRKKRKRSLPETLSPTSLSEYPVDNSVHAVVDRPECKMLHMPNLRL